MYDRTWDIIGIPLRSSPLTNQCQAAEVSAGYSSDAECFIEVLPQHCSKVPLLTMLGADFPVRAED